MIKKRRWYDNEETLKEAMELLSLEADNSEDSGEQFVSKLQEQVAQDIIDKVYETITQYRSNGNRWYDNDPVMMRAIELLKVSNPRIKKKAAKKLLIALSQNSFEGLEFGI